MVTERELIGGGVHIFMFIASDDGEAFAERVYQSVHRDSSVFGETDPRYMMCFAELLKGKCVILTQTDHYKWKEKAYG
jgi:hypothetical protein